MAEQNAMLDAAVAPETASPVVNNTISPPPAAALWSIAKILPAATVPPMVDCHAAAADPAYTPKGQKPQSGNRRTIPTVATAPTPKTEAIAIRHLGGMRYETVLFPALPVSFA
eukprot:CAMPEP_0182825416 /NCGR_PEP_ID=MMETSP0006_2-20121128/15824_1 /TAXON_ID=97485 /ORGANISM="Prymnesium parvum, Strain Texoma1" /LENGTH=112 /DNA_ID=CAMNT_0024952503 /DNA_START=223 /DNA_END=561 /DNA_ORIENTATION=+